MKKALAIVAAMAALVGMSGNAHAEMYPSCGIVTEVGVEGIEVTELNGNRWYIICDSENWEEGNIAAMLCDDMGTEDIYDDEILDIRYCGWTSDDWT